MKKVLFMLVCSLVFTACSSEMEELNAIEERTETIASEILDEATAQKNFAVILSKAVSNNQALRQFIKEDAQKQFDNDHDVFYPYVRNTDVEGGKTFRDILLQFCSESELTSIENSLPLLNILVPDLACYGAFGIDEWNTADEDIAVSYALGNENSVFYVDGDSALSLPHNQIPGFPFIVVKTNAHMKIVNTFATRGMSMDNLQYDFIDDVFNREKNPDALSTRTVSYINYDVPTDGDYLSANELDANIINAYNYYKNNPSSIDRDVIYYHMNSAGSDKGKLDPYYRECLYKFRVNPLAYSSIAEKNEGDPWYDTECHHHKSPFSKEELIEKIWRDGMFDFNFWISHGVDNQQTITKAKIVSVPPSKLFQFKKIKQDYRHPTAFRKSLYTYTVELSDLKSLWVDVAAFNNNKDLYLFERAWDLTKEAQNVYIAVEERDPSITIEKTTSVVNSYTLKTDFAFESAVKTNYGITSGTTETETVKMSWMQKSDDLGGAYMNFYDPVIIAADGSGGKKYKMYTITTGAVEMMIIPKRTR